jgi:hypothetical protein
VPGTERVPAASELRDILSPRLPEYILPAAVVPVSRLPLNANGKLDRAALPPPSPSHFGEATVVIPASEAEHAVAAIFSDVLEVQTVGRAGDFFDLGGYSLSAIRVQNRVRRELGADLQLRTLFETRTVSGLAAAVEAARNGANAPGLVAVLRARPRGVPRRRDDPSAGTPFPSGEGR